MNRARSILFSGSAIAVTLLVIACDQDLIDDPTFHLWCGDKLCSWDLEQGHVRRIPTWHEDDYGVELVDVPTAISQVSHQSPSCIRFTSVAKVDERAQVALEVDFDDDGTVDYTYPVPTSDWHQVETLITAPPAYGSVRFRVVKHGDGVAQLAMIRIQGTDGCSPSQAVALHALPIGDRCGGDGTECASGICCAGVCSQCCDADPAICKGPQCGAPSCAATSVDAGDGGTADGGSPACTQEPNAPVGFFGPYPFQCGPGEHLGQRGSACIIGDDCVSGVCDGATFDYRTVGQGLGVDPDAGAPCTPDPSAGPFGDPTCRAYAVRGGTCQ